MSEPKSASERLVALFLLAVLFFNPPLLSIFNIAEFALGIPVLYLYLFLAWAVLILLMALTIESAGREETTTPLSQSRDEPTQETR